MRTCKVRPDRFQCTTCQSTADFCDTIPPCATCVHKSKVYELVDFGYSHGFGPYAIVISDKKAKIVELDLIYDIQTIKEKHDAEN